MIKKILLTLVAISFLISGAFAAPQIETGALGSKRSVPSVPLKEQEVKLLRGWNLIGNSLSAVDIANLGNNPNVEKIWFFSNKDRNWKENPSGTITPGSGIWAKSKGEFIYTFNIIYKTTEKLVWLTESGGWNLVSSYEAMRDTDVDGSIYTIYGFDTPNQQWETNILKPDSSKISSYEVKKGYWIKSSKNYFAPIADVTWSSAAPVEFKADSVEAAYAVANNLFNKSATEAGGTLRFSPDATITGVTTNDVANNAVVVNGELTLKVYNYNREEREVKKSFKILVGAAGTDTSSGTTTTADWLTAYSSAIAGSILSVNTVEKTVVAFTSGTIPFNDNILLLTNGVEYQVPDGVRYSYYWNGAWSQLYDLAGFIKDSGLDSYPIMLQSADGTVQYAIFKGSN